MDYQQSSCGKTVVKKAEDHLVLCDSCGFLETPTRRPTSLSLSLSLSHSLSLSLCVCVCVCVCVCELAQDLSREVVEAWARAIGRRWRVAAVFH
jgi:hypothetical protein